MLPVFLKPDEERVERVEGVLRGTVLGLCWELKEGTLAGGRPVQGLGGDGVWRVWISSMVGR